MLYIHLLLLSAASHKSDVLYRYQFLLFYCYGHLGDTREKIVDASQTSDGLCLLHRQSCHQFVPALIEVPGVVQ